MKKTMLNGYYHYLKKSITKISLVCFSLLLVACQNGKIEPTPSPTIKETPPVDQVQIDELYLIMFGDALLHGAVYKDAKERHGDYYFDDMFDEIKPLIEGYDLAFYNQETLLASDAFELSSYPTFNGPTAWGDTMMRLGFNLVNTATNHTLDYGEKGVLASRNYWKNQAALVAGSYDSFEDRNTLVVKEKNNIKYTLLAYTYGTNGIPIPEGKEYLVNVYTKAMLEEDIKIARAATDFLIVSMHWGDEYSHEVSDEQKDFANLLAKLDVDLVIGTHVHVIQPIQWIDDTLVYYGLGNMISAQEGTERLTGAYGSLRVRKTTTNGHVELELIEPKANLIYTYYNQAYRQIKLYPYQDLTEDLLKNHSKHYDYFKSILTSLDTTIEIGQTR